MKKLFKPLLLPALFFVFSSWTYAQKSTSSVLEKNLQKLTHAYLKKYSEQEHISAVSLSVSSPKIKNPVTVYSGTTDFIGKIKLNPQHLFQIGSITKSFIAAILLQLEADPKNHFSIDSQLKDFLPQYPKWGHVTIKQLLNMTSGIPSYTEDKKYGANLAENPLREWLPEELVSYVYDKPLETQENRFYYSNTNYILAGMVIAKITGKSLEEEMHQRFFAKNNFYKLDLPNTFYIRHLYPSAILDRLVHGYSFRNHNIFIPKTDITYFTLSWGGAAGANVSNTEDIMRWMQDLFTPGKVLAQDQLAKLKSCVSIKTGKELKNLSASDPDGFGLGIGVSFNSDSPDDLIYNYKGSTLGYRASYIYIPTRNIIIAAAVNSSVDNEVTKSNDHLLELLVDAYNLAK